MVSADAHSSRRLSWKAALLVCATAIVYLPALRSGFVWDDDSMLTGNRLIKATDGLYRFWFTLEPTDYWPVTYITLWVEWRLWGMHALGYHATNLALHIAESLLLWGILRRLRIPGAWLAAFIFAIHPVNVESVAWIAQRKNLMAMLFFLLSIFWFLKTDLFSATDSGHLCRPGASRWYALSLLAFTLGMLSKGSVAALPIVLLGLIAWQRRLAIRDLVRTVPFFFVAAVFTLVDIGFQHHQEAWFIRKADFAERVLGAGGVVWFYLYKALVPLNLIFVYPEWHVRAGNFLWWIPLVTAAVLTVVLWRHRGSWSRSALFAWGYFCVMLVPVLGFTDVYFMKYSLVADHYQHLAIIGPIVFVSAGFALALGQSSAGTKTAVRTLGVLLASGLGFLTYRQCRMYADNETLFRTTLERNPSCWMAHYNLGVIFKESPGRLHDAIAQYEAALKINPDEASEHTALGNAFADMPGRLADAIAEYETALKIDPKYEPAHYNLGFALANCPGRLPEAIVHYQIALRINPADAVAHTGLGNAFADTPGRLADAITEYERALKIDPNHAEAHYNLGNVLADIPDRLTEGIAHYEAALKINPNYMDAHSNLGIVLAKVPGRLDDAVAQFEAALTLNPELVEARNNLGIALARENRIAEAIAQFKEALRIDPNNEAARQNLAHALRQGSGPE